MNNDLDEDFSGASTTPSIESDISQTSLIIKQDESRSGLLSVLISNESRDQ